MSQDLDGASSRGIAQDRGAGSTSIFSDTGRTDAILQFRRIFPTENSCFRDRHPPVNPGRYF